MIEDQRNRQQSEAHTPAMPLKANSMGYSKIFHIRHATTKKTSNSSMTRYPDSTQMN
jgi:hypothetical protein